MALEYTALSFFCILSLVTLFCILYCFYYIKKNKKINHTNYYNQTNNVQPNCSRMINESISNNFNNQNSVLHFFRKIRLREERIDSTELQVIRNNENQLRNITNAVPNNARQSCCSENTFYEALENAHQSNRNAVESMRSSTIYFDIT